MEALKLKHASNPAEITDITELRDLIEFAKHVHTSHDSIPISDFAKTVYCKEIPFGRNKMFRWLRTHKYIQSDNHPYQKYISCGYFVLKAQLDKNNRIRYQTRITAKGQIALLKKLKKEFSMQ